MLVTLSCPTLCDPMDCSPPGSSVHGILQARILERVAISFSRVSSWSKDWTPVSRIAGRFFTIWDTREVATSLKTLIRLQSQFKKPQNQFGNSFLKFCSFRLLSLSKSGLGLCRETEAIGCVYIDKEIFLERIGSEQSYGLCGRGRGWEDLGEWHWNM